MTEQAQRADGCVLSLGSINADFQVCIDRRPEISETLIASNFKRLSGGKAANVAWLARRLQVPARLFAHVGDDDLAEQALAPLHEQGVELAGVRKIANMQTGVAMIMVPPDGKKGIVMSPNANAAWDQADAEQAAGMIRKASSGSVLVTDCEIPAVVVEQAMQAAQQQRFLTILDPSPAEEVTDAILRLADIVVPNPSEAKQLTGIACTDVKTAIDAGKRLLERGAGAACIKLSDGGCVFVSKDQTAHLSPVPVDVVDTTGAGDAFAGALATALVKQADMLKAVGFAVAASHVAVSGYGSRPVQLAPEEIDRFEKRLTVRTDVDR